VSQQKFSRIYVAGCGGMLGEAVYSVLSKTAEVKATDLNVNTSWLSYADVRDYKSIVPSILEFKPDLVVNLAALTDMEQCEREADNAWLTNGLGAENVARAANEVDAGCVYISTAGIFGGEKEYFNDFDVPNPLSIYAKSKYHGERFVCENVRKHYVFRAGWMMGGGLTKDKKFINKLYKQIAAGKSELHVVDDKLGTPTYTWDFANGLSGLIGTELYGVYNQANEGSCSRFDVAVEFVRLLGLAGKIRINRVDSDYFKSEYYAPRPASEKLINLKLNALGLNAMRNWKVCLAEYSATFKQHYQEHVDRSPAG